MTSMNTFGTSPLTRRQLLQQSTCGFGYVALAAMAGQGWAREARADQLSVKPPQFAARAKRVIFLNMSGGPTAQETFDHKPGTSVYKFGRHGQSGLPVSELYPHVGKHADKLCVLHGMHTDSSVHNAASILLHTGAFPLTKPSVGAWVSYGLGTMNDNLPAFVSLSALQVNGGVKLRDSVFLPAACQGTPIGIGSNVPITRNDVQDATNNFMNRGDQRRMLDAIEQRKAAFALRAGEQDPVNGLIDSYEMAFRMQSALPEVIDWSKEPANVLASYGVSGNMKDPTDKFGRQCLVARRLAEAGVRFIALNHVNWDHHRNLKTELPARCKETDQPIAALLGDLEQRGLLEDTLVLWGGEFGRTGTLDRDGGSSDHNSKGYTMWMAGGGVKGGHAHGATDDRGQEAVDGRVHLHDMHATLLHLLGLDHERLTYRFGGRDHRLTDVHGNVVKEVLA